MTQSNAAPILTFLQRYQLRYQLKTCAAIIGGAILALLGPLLITLFCLMFSMTMIASYGFWGTYLRIAAVTLPIFFLIAYKLRGSVLERMAPDGDSLAGRFMQRRVAPLLVITEIANIGPRLVIWGVERVIGNRRVSGVGLGGIGLGRIAQAVSLLKDQSGGVSPARLLLPGEDVSKLEPILAYLLYHEIVDLSKRGDRVWVSSEFLRQYESAMKA